MRACVDYRKGQRGWGDNGVKEGGGGGGKGRRKEWRGTGRGKRKGG